VAKAITFSSWFVPWQPVPISHTAECRPRRGRRYPYKNTPGVVDTAAVDIINYLVVKEFALVLDVPE